MAGFNDIPIRQNGLDHIIEASWFNTIRTKLIEAFGLGGYILEQTPEVLDDDDTITIDSTAFKPLVLLSGNGAAITVNNLPFGNSHGFSGGKEIVITGIDDTNTVELVTNDVADGLMLNGSSVTLKKYYTIQLLYISNLQRFVEVGRNF